MILRRFKAAWAAWCRWNQERADEELRREEDLRQRAVWYWQEVDRERVRKELFPIYEEALSEVTTASTLQAAQDVALRALGEK